MLAEAYKSFASSVGHFQQVFWVVETDLGISFVQLMVR